MPREELRDCEDAEESVHNASYDHREEYNAAPYTRDAVILTGGQRRHKIMKKNI